MGSDTRFSRSLVLGDEFNQPKPTNNLKPIDSAHPHAFHQQVITALVISVLALIFFGFGLSNPPRSYYDEGYYIPAAKALLAGTPNPNPEAPPLGKYLVAAGIELAGDRPVGWRAASTVCGSLSLAAIYLWTYLLSRNSRIALVAAILTLFNNFLFVMSRVAMMDVFLVFFLLWGLAAYTAALELDLSVRKRRILLYCSGISLGLAGACKWNAVDTLAVLLVTSLALPWISKQSSATINPTIARYAENLQRIGLHNLILAFVILPPVSYCLTFWPLCRSLHLPFGIHQLLAMNLYIWRFHIAVVGNPAITSAWYSWPLNLSPQRGLSFLLGNPVIMWGGLVAVAFCIRRFWKYLMVAEGLVVLLYFANLLQWVVTPTKCTYYYYYFPSAMCLGVAIALALHGLPPRIFGVRLKLLVLLAAAVFFLWAYPRMANLQAPWDCALGCWN